MKGSPYVAVTVFLLAGLAGCLGGDGGGPGDETPSQLRDNLGTAFTDAANAAGGVALDAHGLPVPVPLCFATVETDQPVLVDGEVVEEVGATRCDFEMTPDEGRQGNEVTIAVNPLDPRNIVGGAKDYYPADAGECVWDGVYVTHDGGRSVYEDRSFDGSPWRLETSGGDGFTPNYASQFWCTTDPVAYFNTEGTLYYLLMAYQADRVTGSKAGEDVGFVCEELTAQGACESWPGALNDWAFNRATQIIAVSDDGGDTFHTFTPVLEGTFPANFHDKGWIAASHDGTIHVMWLAFFVPGNQYCRSTDEGQTYLCTEIIATFGAEPAGQGSFLEVGTGGEVYASWYSGGIRLKRSMDYGETWGEIQHVQDTNPQSMPGLSDRDRRTGYPAMATDRNPDSPYADALYWVWNDACNDATWSPRGECDAVGNNTIWFVASFDKGETFTEPVRVGHGDADEWSFFPAVSVSPGGVIDVSWMETRGARSIPCPEAPGLGEADCQRGAAGGYPEGEYPAMEQYYAYSIDGGATWSEPVSVRDARDGGWDPALCHHQNGMIFIGDYNDIDSSWQAAHPVWPDARHGPCDVYTATVQRPAFADGWSDEGRAAAETWMMEHPI